MNSSINFSDRVLGWITILTERITSEKSNSGLGIVSMLDYESESEKKSLGFFFFELCPAAVDCACPTCFGA